jgi:hypothetical protein
VEEVEQVLQELGRLIAEVEQVVSEQVSQMLLPSYGEPLWSLIQVDFAGGGGGGDCSLQVAKVLSGGTVEEEMVQIVLVLQEMVY